MSFVSCSPCPWSGRYARIPGEGTVFHLWNVNRRWWPVLSWVTNDGIGTCAAYESDAAANLANAVAAAKIKAGGPGGGSFVINEYGQVLVPASDGSGRRFLAGELHTQLLFKNPFDEHHPIDLKDDSGLEPGDPWQLPYVGFPFNLNRRSEIYFYNVDEEGGQSIYPNQQDNSLIKSLRFVRRNGPVRFIVNPFGVVLTKSPVVAEWSPEEQSSPVYVGRINYNQWFKKENGNA